MTAWCSRHWFLTLSMMFALALFTGLVGPPRDLIPDLASRPEVRDAFQDPNFGRQDAMLFLFSFLFFSPFAGVVSFLLAMVILGAVSGMLIPLGRQLGISEWASTTVLAVGLLAFVYVQRAAWTPPVLRLLGLVAKSWVVVIG